MWRRGCALKLFGLRWFSAWLVEEGEAPTSHLLGLKALNLDTKLIGLLADVHIKAIIEPRGGQTWATIAIKRSGD